MRRYHGMGDTAAPANQPPAPQYASEEPALLRLQVVLQANEDRIGVVLPIEKELDFTVFSLFGNSTGDYELNFQLPSGRMFCSSKTGKDHLVGTATFPVSIGVPQMYQGGSGISVDLKDLSGAQNTVTLLFKGIRRVR